MFVGNEMQQCNKEKLEMQKNEISIYMYKAFWRKFIHFLKEIRENGSQKSLTAGTICEMETEGTRILIGRKTFLSII